MGDILSLLFLVAAAFYDIKDRIVNPALVGCACLVLMVFSIVTGTPLVWLNALYCWIVCFALAWLLDKKGIEFGAGDGKAVALIGGFSGFFVGIGSLVIALSFWVMAEHPKKVAFVPYLLVGFLVMVFIKARI